MFVMETSVPKYDLAEYHQPEAGIVIPTKGVGTLESKRMVRPSVKVSVVGMEGLRDGTGNVRVPTIVVVTLLTTGFAFA
jgi:hypothetical protein